MNWGAPDLVFSPSVPWPVIAIPLGLAMALLLWALIRRARGGVWRAVPLAALALALLDPRLAGEERMPLDDIAVVLVDDSDSQSVGGRRAQADRALAEIEERLSRQPNLEVRVERVKPPIGRDEGTRLFSALDRAIGDIPRRRLAGVVLVTDGQVHDVPAEHASIGAPVHVLLTGRPGEGDRRLVVEKAPGFGIVGNAVRVAVKVEDPGGSGAARLSIRRDGARPLTLSLPVNATRNIEIPIEHAGATVVELESEPGERELTLANNRAAVTIQGVRDRLRVLLVSGEPHQGERTWRNLLKADPSVDLVHFTILRPPEKDDSTPLKELALISFPIRELFEEKLEDFDLIIFDRYRRRAMMPLNYYENIAHYVRQGGALLMAVGPEFNEAFGIYGTPLETILPGLPADGAVEDFFRPSLTETGRRHPVTAGLGGADPDKPEWGPWARVFKADGKRGRVLMAGPEGLPLLLLDDIEQGRVAQILTDTIWLWARGYQGGGPQAELLRRLAHWLMKEPALEAETLRAEARGEELHIERRSLTPGPVAASLTLPDGAEKEITLADQGDGRATAVLSIARNGLYRVSDGVRTAIAAAGSVNPIEMNDLAATSERLAPVAAATGGGLLWLAEDAMPEFRRIAPERGATGRGWLGLRANNDYLVAAVRDVPLLPAPLLLLLGLGGLVMAWWREGK